MDEITAILRARQLLGRLGINAAPVDVSRIAATEGFEIRLSNTLEEGEAGSVVKKGDRKIILLNRKDHPYRQRFTVLHEIAHEALSLPSIHGETLASTELERYRGRPQEEVLCDVFAAECLVPWQQIQPLTETHDFSVSTISILSDQFQASKACVASRFARSSRDLLGYVLSENGIVRHAITSCALRDARIWIQSGIALPDGSAAARAIAKNSTVEMAELDGSDWSNSEAADAFGVCEQAINGTPWEQTMSLLTFEAATSASRIVRTTSREEEELLPELTGVLLWPKR